MSLTALLPPLLCGVLMLGRALMLGTMLALGRVLMLATFLGTMLALGRVLMLGTMLMLGSALLPSSHTKIVPPSIAESTILFIHGCWGIIATERSHILQVGGAKAITFPAHLGSRKFIRHGFEICAAR